MNDYLNLAGEIKKGRYYNVYICLGENRFFTERFVGELKRGLFEGGGIDFNCEVVDASVKKITEIIDSANQLPVFADRRLVVAENFKQPKNNDAAILVRYLENPSPRTVLVIELREGKLSAAFSKAMGKKGKVVKFKDPSDKQLPYWIREIAAGYGKSLDPDAIEYFINFVGNDLQRVDSELSKLAAYVEEREKITVKDVNSMTSDTKVETIFTFIDSISGKNLGQGLKMLDKMIRAGEMPVRIITMLARHYRLLWKVKKHLRTGMGGAKLAGVCGINPYFLPKYVSHSKNFSKESLIKIIGHLARADVELKTLNISKRLLLEKLCFDLTSI